MSYCVNCGVELAPSEKSCPLCHVEVINPAVPWQEPASRPYPRRADKIIEQVNRSYGAGLASLFLLIPTVITLLVDLLTNGHVAWSSYVAGGCFLAFVVILVPLLFKKPNAYICIGLDALALLAYLGFIAAADGKGWFGRLAFPIVLAAALFSVFFVAMVRHKKWPFLIRAGSVFLAAALLCVALDVIINWFGLGSFRLLWSPYAAAPCVICGVMLFFTERHQNLRETIRRRLFY